MAPPSSTETLVRRAQQGDGAAFEALVSAHLGQIRRFARAFAAGESDADDLAQEALMKVYRALGSYRFEAAFSTWLFALVRNCCLDAVKSRAGKDRAREHALDTHDGPDSAPLPDAEIERAQNRERLWRAIERMPVEFKTAVVLFDVEELSHEEIAAIEGVPIGTVKSRLSRGRKWLSEALCRPRSADAESGNPGPASVVLRSERLNPS